MSSRTPTTPCLLALLLAVSLAGCSGSESETSELAPDDGGGDVTVPLDPRPLYAPLLDDVDQSCTPVRCSHDFAGTEWRFVRYREDDGTEMEVPTEQVITVLFSEVDDAVAGQLDCNTYRARHTYTDERLVVTDLEPTVRECGRAPEETGAVRTFLEALSDGMPMARPFQRELTVRTTDNRVLVFEGRLRPLDGFLVPYRVIGRGDLASGSDAASPDPAVREVVFTDGAALASEIEALSSRDPEASSLSAEPDFDTDIAIGLFVEPTERARADVDVTRVLQREDGVTVSYLAGPFPGEGCAGESVPSARYLLARIGSREASVTFDARIEDIVCD